MKQAPSLVNETDLVAFPPGKIGFYGGTFFPPHLGHQAVVECSLCEHLDYAVVAPHYHNPDKAGSVLKSLLPQTIELLEIMFQNSEYGNKVYILDPKYLVGVQNRAFSDLAQRLRRLKIIAHVIIGNEAIKDNYPEFMYPIPHIVAPRPGYETNHARLDKLLCNYSMLNTLDVRTNELISDNIRNYPEFLRSMTKTGTPVKLKLGKAIFQVLGRRILKTNSPTISELISGEREAIRLKCDEYILVILDNEIVEMYSTYDYEGLAIETDRFDDYCEFE